MEIKVENFGIFIDAFRPLVTSFLSPFLTLTGLSVRLSVFRRTQIEKEQREWSVGRSIRMVKTFNRNTTTSHLIALHRTIYLFECVAAMD